MAVLRRPYPTNGAASIRSVLRAASLGAGAARGRQSTTTQAITLGDPTHLRTLTAFVVIVTARIGIGTSGDHALVAKRSALGPANVGWIIGSNGIGSLWARWNRASNMTIEANLAGGGPGPANWFRFILALDDSLSSAPIGLVDRGNDGRWSEVTWNVSTVFGSGAATADTGQNLRIGNSNGGTLGWQGEIAHVSIWPKLGGRRQWVAWAENPRLYARNALLCVYPGENGNPNSIVDYSRLLATSAITNSGFYGVNGPDDLYQLGARGLFEAKVAAASAALATNVGLVVAGTHDVSVAKPVATSVSMALTATGGVTVAKPLAGAVNVALTSTEALSVPKPLASAIALALTAGPDLSAGGSGAALAAALTLALTSSADVSVPKPLAAAPGLVFTSVEALTVPKDLAASLGAALTLQGDLTGGSATLATTLALAMTSASALTVPKDLAAALALSLAETADLTALGGAAALQTALSLAVTPAALLAVPKPVATALALAFGNSLTLTSVAPSAGVCMVAGVLIVPELAAPVAIAARFRGATPLSPPSPS